MCAYGSLANLAPGPARREGSPADPELVAFDAAAFGDARLRPAYPIAASIAPGEIALQRIRYVVRPDVRAFEGMEVVA